VQEEILTGHAVNPDEFRKAWSFFGTGVTVITTREPDGKVHGMTASSVISVSLNPPLALASVGHNRNSHPLIQRNSRFGLSILNAEQEHVARHFTMPAEQRVIDGLFAYEDVGASPAIAGALSVMDCKVVAEHVEGDHTLFVARVEHVKTNEGEPMIWYRGQFGSFVPGKEC
jgi:flavin reductase (DIM6/NTAB) family NADH-FMN oxidoreductase RutF